MQISDTTIATEMASLEWALKKFISDTLDMSFPRDLTEGLRNGELIQFINKMLPEYPDFTYYGYFEGKNNFEFNIFLIDF